MVATSSLTLCHVLFFLIPASNDQNISYWGVAPIVHLGITYSIYVAALWPMVPLVVKPQVVGSAYGLCTAVQNIGLAIAPTIVGAVTFKESDAEEDTSGANNNAFNYVSIVLGSFAFMGVLSSIGLLIADRVYYDGLLQKPSAKQNDNGEHVDILASPSPSDTHNLAVEDENLKVYTEDRAKRDFVRKSIARSSVAR